MEDIKKYKFCPREIEVMRLLVLGYSNKLIAKTLGIKSEQVIKNYCRSIFNKIGCKNRIQCAIWWLRISVDKDAMIADLRFQLDVANKELAKWRRRLG